MKTSSNVSPVQPGGTGKVPLKKTGDKDESKCCGGSKGNKKSKWTVSLYFNAIFYSLQLS